MADAIRIVKATTHKPKPKDSDLGFGTLFTDHMFLADFQEEVVHQLCLGSVFPELVASMKGAAIRAASAEMVSGGVSQDAGVVTAP